MTTHDQEHQDSGEPESGGIRPEAPPFEPGYQPGSVPEITVPDLAEDAVGVSAEVLAEAAIPTLTEQVLPAVVEDDEVPEDKTSELVATEPETQEPPQEPEVQADTWHEQMQVRMSKLTGEIQTLNDRLDRLEQRAKNKG
jgi:septal ring-binding cell division protein DamX